MVYNYFWYLIPSQQHVAQDLSVEKPVLLTVLQTDVSNWTSFTVQLVLNSQQMLLLSSRKDNTPPSSKAESNSEPRLCVHGGKKPNPKCQA